MAAVSGGKTRNDRSAQAFSRNDAMNDTLKCASSSFIPNQYVKRTQKGLTAFPFVLL
jgi:hypothetical protein